jgi:FlgD Ig-like domain
VRRLPVVAFAALVLATVAAFFVVQHLKVTTPLIAGFPAPYPSVINPVNGTTCKGVDHRVMRVSFYLQHRSDDVDVYIVDSTGQIVRTIASGRHMRRGVRNPDGDFVWDGREDNGSFAPDGQYYIKVALINQGRTVEISNTSGQLEPVTVKTVPPHPVVIAVTPKLTPPPAGRSSVAIRYRGNENQGATVQLYRTDVPGKPQLVKRFFNPANKAPVATWDGRISGLPAPAGIYLAGLSVTDAACNVGRFPATIPPAPGSTPHAGVTVRYLAAQPPRYPAPAGSRTLLYVDARQRPYRWTLLRVGVKKPVSSGSSQGYALRVRLPGGGAGLYQLDLRSGTHTTAVPLLASGSGGPRVLVVLPALTWQGQNPGDEDGDGMPDTLDAGLPVSLARPLAHGLPPGFTDEAALLAYLDKAHLPYDLTTDLGLIDHVGPQPAGHAAVVFAGTERWIPSSLGSALTSYVQGGGHVLSFGTDAFRRGVTVQRSTALDPTGPTAADVFGARPGGLVTQSPSDLITVITDQLGLFSNTSGALPGFRVYQPFAVSPPGKVLSSAGATSTAPSIVGYRLGRGLVIDIGLPGFGSQLAKNVDAQEFVNQAWKVIGG